jgi:hypothetical protein
MDGYFCSESSCLDGVVTPGVCEDPSVDLASIISPYSGSILDSYVSLGGSGPERGFSAVLQPDQRIRINQVSNTFDSVHALRYGGGYPGIASVDNCENNNEFEEAAYTNSGTAAVKVYFVVEAYYSSTSEGDFELAWVIDTPGGSCDVSTVVVNAADTGDCEVELASGSSCTNAPNVGFTCRPSTCLDGILTAGVCDDGIFTAQSLSCCVREGYLVSYSPLHILPMTR